MRNIILALLAIILLGGVFFYTQLRPQTQTPEQDAPEVVIPQPTNWFELDSNIATLDEVKKDEPAQSVINVDAGNFFYTPTSFVVDAGMVTVNVGDVTGLHTFVIDELSVKRTLQSGTSFTFEATAGTYQIYCGVNNHRQMGQVATLTVN